jgi:UPF0271 protein
MTTLVDINADLGESFGIWKLGNDEEFMPFVSSVNIACGWHAGDPHIMRRSVELALENGCGIGSHVGFPDKIGFGRRHLKITPAELRDYILYQTGALQAFVTSMGGRLQHIKPHGACYYLTAYSAEHGAAVAKALLELDDNLIMISSGPGGAAAREVGATVAWEGYVDLEYDANGDLLLERSVLPRDAKSVADRTLKLVQDKVMPTVDGGQFDLEVDTICLHGDSPTAVEVARAVRERLAEGGVEVAPLYKHKLTTEKNQVVGSGSAMSKSAL